MSGKRERINILIADRSGKITEELKEVLETSDGLNLVGVVKNDEEILGCIREKKVDLIVLDVSMRSINRLEAVRLVLEGFPKIKVLTIAMGGDVQLIAEVFKAGAHGILHRKLLEKEIASAVSAVMQEEFYLCARMIDSMINAYVSPCMVDSVPSEALSKRQSEVLRLLVKGGTTRSIAEELSVSAKTVESHRRELMKKLKIYCVSGLTKYALRQGLTSLND